MAKKEKTNTSARPPKTRRRLRFIGGFIADDFSPAGFGKISAHGIFSTFWAWSFPCHRHAAIMILLLGQLRKTITVRIFIKKKGAQTRKLLGKAQSEADKPEGVHMLPFPSDVTFEADGQYEFLCTLQRSADVLRIPFYVKEHDWPKYTTAEMKYAADNPNSTLSIRANVRCDKCKHVYIFEESILPSIPPAGGVYRFPESGRFVCRDCPHILNLRDLHGQVREGLKQIIKANMARKI